MKLLIMLFFLPVVASAQSNGSCPLKLPFEIDVSISGTGITSSESNLPHYTSPPPETVEYSETYTIRIDTIIPGSSYSFKSDSLIFSDSLFDTLSWASAVKLTNPGIRMYFDTLTSHVTIYIYWISEYSTKSAGNPVSYYDYMRLNSATLPYHYDSLVEYGPNDSSDIIASDFNIEHFVNIGLGEYSTLSGTTFDSGTVEISGRTVPLASVAPDGSALRFSIYLVNGMLHCDFTSADHSRALELYTPLGMKAASFEIPPGLSEISIPQLPSGLYFVRMDGAIFKIAVP